MKKRGNISIKAKLLGVITPVVIAIVVVLVLVSYLASAHIIENYSQNLLESSVMATATIIRTDYMYPTVTAIC